MTDSILPRRGKGNEKSGQRKIDIERKRDRKHREKQIYIYVAERKKDRQRERDTDKRKKKWDTKIPRKPKSRAYLLRSYRELN